MFDWSRLNRNEFEVPAQSSFWNFGPRVTRTSGDWSSFILSRMYNIPNTSSKTVSAPMWHWKYTSIWFTSVSFTKKYRAPPGPKHIHGLDWYCWGFKDDPTQGRRQKGDPRGPGLPRNAKNEKNWKDPLSIFLRNEKKDKFLKNRLKFSKFSPGTPIGAAANPLLKIHP